MKAYPKIKYLTMAVSLLAGFAVSGLVLGSMLMQRAV